MASKSEIRDLTVDGVCDFLDQQLGEDIVARETIEEFKENRINGEAFVELTDEELTELVPKIGERKAIKRIIDRPQKEKTKVCYFFLFLFLE